MGLASEERDKLKANLAGMVNAAWNKFPGASAGDLMDLWRQVVEEANKRRKARARRRSRGRSTGEVEQASARDAAPP